MAAHFLDKAGIAYEKIYADKDAVLAKEFDIKQAPTLVNIKNGTAEKIVNLSNIKAFSENYGK